MAAAYKTPNILYHLSSSSTITYSTATGQNLLPPFCFPKVTNWVNGFGDAKDGAAPPGVTPSFFHRLLCTNPNIATGWQFSYVLFNSTVTQNKSGTDRSVPILRSRLQIPLRHLPARQMGNLPLLRPGYLRAHLPPPAHGRR